MIVLQLVWRKSHQLIPLNLNQKMPAQLNQHNLTKQPAARCKASGAVGHRCPILPPAVPRQATRVAALHTIPEMLPSLCVTRTGDMCAVPGGSRRWLCTWGWQQGGATYNQQNILHIRTFN